MLIDYVATLELRPASLAAYLSHAKRITQALGDPGACSFAEIEAWYQSHPCGPETRRIDLGLVRGYLRWRRLHGLPGPDLDDWRPRVRRAPDEAGRALSKAEARALLAALRPPLRELVTVALLSGLRRGNLMPTAHKPGLLREHYDLETGCWAIPGALMKAGRPLTVPIHPEALQRLPEDPGGPVWRLRDPRRALAAAWAGVSSEAPAPMWHDFRRTFATWLAEAGVNQYDIARLMGHKPLGVTGIYVRPTQLTLTNALTKLWV